MKISLNQKKIFYSLFSVVFTIIMVLMLNTELVYAAGATLSISSSEVTQGEEFEVIVNIKADSNIGAYNFYIDYDADILEAVSGFSGGGNGRIQLIYYVPNTDVKKEMTAKIKFKAKKPGTSSIKYVSISDDNGVIDFDTADNMSVTATAGSVKVKAPYVASTDNYLTNLKVEAVKSDGSTYTLDLSPKFSKDVTKYNAKAVEGVTKLVITAGKSDSKATVNMAGRNMDPGDNTTTITVTAEDGSTRKYVIYTYVEKKPETTTPPPEPIKVQIDGADAYIKDIDNSVKLPEGFEKVDYQYKGEDVVAAKGLVKSLIIMYVTKGENDSGQLYIYDESADIFYPMSNLQLTQKLYTIVNEPQDLIIPAGFVETTITVDEQTIRGWSNSEIENIYLVYAMNWNGEKGLYYYDANEGQIIRYFDVTIQVGADTGVELDDYNNLVSQNENLKNEINRLKSENTKDEAGSVQLYKYLALGCCVMAVIYLGIIIYLVVAKKNKRAEEAESENNIIEEESEDKIIEESEDESATEVNVSVEETATETLMAEEIHEEISLTENGQDDIDDTLMDFEDIITAETAVSVAEEEDIKDLNDDDKLEISEELVPEIAEVESESILTEKSEAIESAKVDDDVSKDAEEVKTEIEKTNTEDKQQNNGDKKIESDDKDDDKKKKVAEIMDDDDSSINSDDLDMVIDELFDDLFD